MARDLFAEAGIAPAPVPRNQPEALPDWLVPVESSEKLPDWLVPVEPGTSGRDLFAEAGISVERAKPVKERSWARAAGDTAIDVAKGAVGLGETLVGVADLATGNLAGRALGAIGYDPAQTKEMLSSGYSDTRQQANRNVADAKGFWNTAGALVDNPSAAVGSIAESAPMMLGSMAAVRMAATKMLAARGLVAGSAEAAAFLQNPAVVARLTAIGSASEGAMTAGNIQEQGRQAGRDYTDTAPAALVGGALTGAIGFGTSRIPGFKDAEVGAAIAGMGGGTRQGLITAGKEIAKGTFKEGVLEEMPQSAQEQIFTNLATGKPWDEGVAEAAAQGMVVGAGMGAGMNTYSSGRNALSRISTPNPSALPQSSAPGEQPSEPIRIEPANRPPLRPEARLAELDLLTQDRDPTPQELAEMSSLIGTMDQPGSGTDAQARQTPPAFEDVPDLPGAGPATTDGQTTTPSASTEGRDLFLEAGIVQAPTDQAAPAITSTPANAVDSATPWNGLNSGDRVQTQTGTTGTLKFANGLAYVIPDTVEGGAPGQNGLGVFSVTPAEVSRSTAAAPAPAQVPKDFWSYAKQRGFTPNEVRKGSSAWTALQADYKQAKAAPATPGRDLYLEAGIVAPVASPPAIPQPISAQQQTPEQTQPEPSLQNRDRSRAASVMQMSAIARDPDYMRLGTSRTPDAGAPMVFPVGDDRTSVPDTNFGHQDVAVMADGQRVPFVYAVVSADKIEASNFADGRTNPAFSANVNGTLKALNNGRSAGLRAAYDMGTASKYQQELIADAPSHGVSVQAIQSTPNPVLVRIYSEASNTPDMAAKSQGQGLAMSPTELALQDAPLLDASVLAMHEQGDVTSAGNRDFVRAFVGKLKQAGQDTAAMMTAEGTLSPAGRQRIQAALMQSAYGDADLVAELFDSLDTDVKAIGEALKTVAGEWANMRDSARWGIINPEADITASLVQAVNLIRKARRERTSLYELTRQPDLMTGETPDPVAVGALSIFYPGQYYTRAAGRDSVVASLRDYVRTAMGTSADADMFGQTVTPTNILDSITNQGSSHEQPQTNQSSRGTNGGSNLVGGPAPTSTEAGQQRSTGERGSPGEDRQGERQDTPGTDGQANQATGQGNEAQELIASEPTPDYSSPYEVDLFGNPLPDAGRRTPARAQRPAAATGNIRSATGLSDTAAPAGDYYVNTLVGSEVSRTLGSRSILTPAQAAQATAYLYRSAVERFDAIVTDAKGKPLAVVGGFKGAVSQASVYPGTIVGEAVRIPGAARIWFSHNHPSGTPTLSNADQALNLTLSNVFRGSGIEPMGLLAVAGQQYAHVDAAANRYSNPTPTTGDFPAPEQGAKVPVLDRELIQGNNQAKPQIDSPQTAQAMAKSLYTKAKVPGLMLLDAQNALAAWIPLPDALHGRLRHNGGLNAIYRAASQSNASAAIIVHGGELSKIGNLPTGLSASENIAAALASVDVRPLDSIDVKAGTSAASIGVSVALGPVYSRSGSSKGLPASTVQQVIDQVVSNWTNAPDVVVLASMADAPEAVRKEYERQNSKGATGSTEGFFYAGTVYVVADQLATATDVMRVLFHEALGHMGLRGAFGDAIKPVLVNILQARRSEVAAKAKQYGLDMDNREDALTAAEEVLAEMAQTKPEIGFVTRAVAAIRTWLRTNVPGFKDLNLTDAEIIRSYILPARDFVQRGQTAPAQAASAPAFIRNSLGGTPPTPIPPVQNNAWTVLKNRVMKLTSPENIDKLIYEFQDKHIDLKRVIAHIKELGGTVTDLNDAYLGEELFHKRLAKRTEDFLADELKPMLAQMKATDVTMEELETYLHARHAPEANAAMAKRNPNAAELDAIKTKANADMKALELQLQHAKAKGTATKAIEKSLDEARAEVRKWFGAQAYKGSEQDRLSLSGMSDSEAAAHMANLTPGKRQHLDALAAKVDAINSKTLDLLERYGLMDPASISAWRSAYQFYIPLHRDEARAEGSGHPVGMGFSVKGDAAKQRTGSNRKVTHILGHIAMQREAALTRGEKNLVAKKLYLLAAQNPDDSVWSVDTPPVIKSIDQNTGIVRIGVDPVYKHRPNVLMVRIAGKDVAIVFNEENKQAMRLAESMKSMDIGDLHVVLGLASKGTRWFASINTQYNPIFGLVNFARDFQEGMLNLSTTPLAGQQREIAQGVPAAMRAVYRQARGKGAANAENAQWIKLWDEMQNVGGATGYRDLYADAEDRVKALTKDLDALDRGEVSKAAHAVVDWLSHYNEAMENAVRLSAYKAALDSGMTKARAASLAKNLTVNFNRKGRQTREIGALYAFFNAAIQGTTRMAETLKGPMGKRIMYGGIALGAVNGLIGMALMGGGGDGEDDEWEKIPEFIKENSLIIPIGRKDYLSIPMPLGFKILPNIGRLAVEFALGGPDKTAGKQLGKLLAVLVDSFNPLGGSQNLGQMVAPTVIDPVVALMQNRDWTGRPIYRENTSSLDPQPGHMMAKNSASTAGKGLAKAINSITGGTDYRPGMWSPTPDQLDYVFGQLTGGLGRELLKANQVITTPFTGDELPAYKIPLIGRVYGNTSGPAAQSEQFYANVRELNEVHNEMKGLAKRGGDSLEAYRKSEPLTGLAGYADDYQRRVSGLRKMRADVVEHAEPGYQKRVKEIDAQIGETMGRLNKEVSKARKSPTEP